MARRAASTFVGRKGEDSEGWRIVDWGDDFGIGMSVDPCFRRVAMVGGF